MSIRLRSARIGQAATLLLSLSLSPSAHARAPSPNAAPTTDAFAAPASLQVPGGFNGIELVNARYVAELNKVLVPGGHTGALVVLDPAQRTLKLIDALGPIASSHSDRVEGIASVAYATDHFFVTDRGTRQLSVVDARSGKVLERMLLADEPDSIHYLAARRELWIAQPRAQQVEVIGFDANGGPRLRKSATIMVPQGPVALTLDETRGKGLASLWLGEVAVIDIAERKVTARHPSGCRKPLGIAFDAGRARLYIACADGKVVARAVPDGRLIGEVAVGPEPGTISMSRDGSRLHVVSARDRRLTEIAVDTAGALSIARQAQLPRPPGWETDRSWDEDGVRTASGTGYDRFGRPVQVGAVSFGDPSELRMSWQARSFSIAEDEAGNLVVCDPPTGRLLIYRTR